MSLPWYKWHAADWVRCETRFELTLAERGIYRDLLDLHYLEGSIPKNPRVLVGFLASPEEVEAFQKSWEKISKLFQEHPSDPERLVNRRAVAMIQEQRKFQKTQRLNGSKGGRPKKTHGLANSNPTETHGLAKRKPSQSQSQSQSEEEEEETPSSPPVQDWSPWPDAEYAREAILDAYPNKVGQTAARTYWQAWLVEAVDAPKQARLMFAAAKLIAERCPPEKVQYLGGARKFLAETWADPWEQILDSWTREKQGKASGLMEELERMRREA